MKTKPLGKKTYGSIPHLSKSKIEDGVQKGHRVNGGQEAILTIKTRDKNDTVIVQEKVDGSNTAVANIEGDIVALTRAGLLANESQYRQHKAFAKWVDRNKAIFHITLYPNEYISGEWLAMAHGTKYNIKHQHPFLAFDLWGPDGARKTYEELRGRLAGLIDSPKLIHYGGAISIHDADKRLGKYGWHGAKEHAEGLVYRLERNGKVEFLAKYVRPNKVAGKYFTESEDDIIWNTGLDGWITQ